MLLLGLALVAAVPNAPAVGPAAATASSAPAGSGQATAGTPAAPAMTPAVAVRLRPTREQVAAAVRAEWPRYDEGLKGRLTPLEFSTWVMQANGATVAPAGQPADRRVGLSPISAMNAASRAFMLADRNHDNFVSPNEMIDFLMR